MGDNNSGFKVDKLTADNYHHWKFNMRMFLIGKTTDNTNLWEIVEGTYTLPARANDDQRRKFKKLDNSALSNICLSVSNSLQIYVRGAKSAKEAWDSLSGHFEEKTLSRIISYRRKLYALRMERGTTMTDHVNSLKTIAEHLESLDDEVAEKDLVKILISSLPDSYNNLITALESVKEHELTWTYVRDRAINEYERRKGDGKPKKNNLDDALFSKNDYVRKKKGGSHIKSEQQQNNNKTKFKCHYCHEKGHFIKDCKKKAQAEEGKNDSASFCKNKNKLKVE